MEKAVSMEKAVAIGQAVAMGKAVPIEKALAIGQKISIEKDAPMMAAVGKSVGQKMWCADGTCRNIDLQNFASDVERRFVNNVEAEKRFINPRELGIRVSKLKEYIDDRYVSKDQLRAFAEANNLKFKY